MPYFFYYLLKVILCSAVLFGYYHLFLRNKVYHAYNRFYLLAATVISLVVPFLNFNVLFHEAQEAAPSIQLLQAVNSSDAYLEEMIIYSHKNYLTGSQLVLLLYCMVSVVMLALLIKVFIQLFRILKSNSSRNLKDVVFVQSDAKGTPFSFFKFIFWNNAIDINTPTGRQIFAHELAHVREKHSADKLYINLLLIVFWINPLFWLIKKELNLIHEFIADKKAGANNDAGALAAMIVQSAYPQHAYLLTSHFFYSPIKRRLQMLTKYNNKKAGYFYRILALPLVLMLVALLTVKAKSGITTLLNPAEKITVVIDAGHGGLDGGSMAIDQLTREKDLNLQLLRKIKALNQFPNIDIVFTRETDIYQSPEEKTKLIVKAAADLFISLHVSSAPAGEKNTKSGMEVYVAKDHFTNSFSSKVFASSLISIFKNNYALPVASNPLQRAVGIKVIQTNCPSVLIEAGYISNSSDLAYLQSEAGQTAFAKNILATIAQYAAANKNELLANFKVQRDTVPGYGSYKGQKITGIQVSSRQQVTNVLVQLANGEKINMTAAAAKKAGIQLPPPPPPPPAPAKPAAPPPPPPPPPAAAIYAEDRATDASQRTTTKQARYFPAVKKISLRGVNAENPASQPLFVLNGAISNEPLNSIDPDDIESITVLKGEKAIKKYGRNEALNGVIEIETKTAAEKAPVKYQPLTGLPEEKQ